MHYTFILLKGVLALNDYVIPGEVYAWAAVILLPINSAINPFLYTVTAIFGKAVGTFTVVRTYNLHACFGTKIRKINNKENTCIPLYT